ncbi:MAG: type I secretion protein TolC [Burkholderiales bacterium]|nr:MAG: type I secretion protein TolC [Burkholderiales bacterium]
MSSVFIPQYMRDLLKKQVRRLEAARRQFEATAEKLVQARASLLPHLSLNASTSRQKGVASFNDADYADRTVRNSAWTLQLAQPLWRPVLGLAYDQAELQAQQAQHVLQHAETELILRVSQAYFDALVATESISVAQTQVKAVEQQLALVQRNFEAGLTTVTDVHEAQARLALANAQHIGAMTESAARATELEKLLGEPTRPLARLLVDAVPAFPEPAQVQNWIDLALAAHPLLRSQQLSVAIADREVAKLEKAHGPALEATAGYGRNTGTGSMTSPTEVASRSRSVQVGLQFSLPLYAGGAVQSRVREAVALREKAAAELEATRRQLTAQVRQAFTAVVNGHLQIQALVHAAQASKAAVDANKVGYRIGTRLNIDVLNAEQQQFLAERDLHKARADTLMQTLRLQAAGARLGEDDLRAVGRLLKGE